MDARLGFFSQTTQCHDNKTGTLQLGNIVKPMPFCEVADSRKIMYIDWNVETSLALEGIQLILTFIKQNIKPRPIFVIPGSSAIVVANVLQILYGYDTLIVHENQQPDDIDLVKLEYFATTSGNQKQSLCLCKEKANKLQGREIVILDSVSTSGNTLRAIHQLLMNAGVNPAHIRCAMVLFTQGQRHDQLQLENGDNLNLVSFGHLETLEVAIAPRNWRERLKLAFEITVEAEAEAHKLYKIFSDERDRAWFRAVRNPYMSREFAIQPSHVIVHSLYTENYIDFITLCLPRLLEQFRQETDFRDNCNLQLSQVYRDMDVLLKSNAYWNKAYTSLIVSQSRAARDSLEMLLLKNNIMLDEKDPGSRIFNHTLYEILLEPLIFVNAVESFKMLFNKVCFIQQPPAIAEFLIQIMSRLVMAGRAVMLDNLLEINMGTTGSNFLTCLLKYALYDISKLGEKISRLLNEPALSCASLTLRRDLNALFDCKLQTTYDIIAILIKHGADPDSLIIIPKAAAKPASRNTYIDKTDPNERINEEWNSLPAITPRAMAAECWQRFSENTQITTEQRGKIHALFNLVISLPHDALDYECNDVSNLAK